MPKESPPEEADGLPPREGAAEEKIVLPPELWASVMECLPYESILSCAATCRSLLHDALPSLRKLRIDTSAQMNLKVAARFRDIREIQINSLLTQRIDDDGDKIIQADFETTVRIAPFLACFANTLEKISFGGKGEYGEDIEKFSPVDAYIFGDEDEEDVEDRDRMLSVIDSISAAFRVGALPKHLQISGLVCPRSTKAHNPPGSGCETCRRACRSFPISSIVYAECMGSSLDKARSERPWTIDLCLRRTEIEFLVETRPGGCELLRSKERVLRLLGSGMRRRIVSGNGHVLHIVHYDPDEIDELERVIQCTKLDTKTLPAPEVVGAIMRSFAKDGGGPVPPRNQCYLSEESYDALKEKLDICVDKNDIYAPLEDMRGVLPHIAHALLQVDEAYDEDDLVDHDFELDCLRLMRRLLELDSPPRQSVVDLGLAPRLVTRIGIYADAKGRQDLACSLKILLGGTEEQRKAVIRNERAVESFTSCLLSSKASVIECGISALIHIARMDREKYTEALEKAGVIPKLVSLLDWQRENDVIVEDSLLLLSISTKNRIQGAVKEGLLRHLARIMLSSEEASVLAHCSILLRWIVEISDPPIQELIDLELFPRLADLLKSNQDDVKLNQDDTQLNLAHVMINLTRATAEQTQFLVEKEDFVSVLIRLFDCPSELFAKEAMLKVGKFAHGLKSRDKMLPGIVASLIGPLNSNDVGMLRIATGTLSICFKGELATFATSKGVTALSKLLAHGDETVALNAVWALYYLLGGFKGEEVSDEEVKSTPTNVVFRVKKHALWAVFQTTKGASFAQIEYMVTQECLDHLCNQSLLLEDTNTSVTTIWVLRKILKAGQDGKNEATTSSEADTSNVKAIEDKLQELIDENFRLERENGRVEVLKKKRGWIFYDQQHQYVNSLSDTCKFLTERSLEMRGQLQSFEDEVGTKRPLKQFCTSLREKHNELKRMISSQNNDLHYDLKEAKAKLDMFEKDAEESAPKEEWEQRLSEDDIPTDLAGVNKALDTSADILRSINATRRSVERKKDIDAMKELLKELFKREDTAAPQNVLPDDSASKKRKRADVDGGADDDAPAVASVENPGNQKDESVKKPKKKKQRSIAAFFGKALQEN